MDQKKIFPYQCNLFSLTFSKQWNKDRHMQTMHDKSKYSCDVCFTEFTRLHALNNHRKAGRCKLDLHRNPIIQVTPLLMIPSTSSQEKVNNWLNPDPVPPKIQRMDIVCEQPSTSTTMDPGPSTPITPVKIKGARKQLLTKQPLPFHPRTSSGT